MSMSRMIQIRNVPDEIHSQLKARAALEGMTLSDYLLREVRLVVERPRPSELRSRLLGRKRVKTRVTPARAVRAERDRR
jgi:plasmid stability protein